MFGCLSNLQKKQTLRSSESGGDFGLDYRINFVFSGELFPSVRQTAKKAMISKSLVYRHLTQTMRKLPHFQGVTYGPTESEKMNLVQRATNLLELLELIRHEVWECIITLDDSWFQ
jgi:hypothetical protein